MNFQSKSAHSAEPDINLIPLIDVLLVMLIFLAATTTFTRDRQLNITLPYASAEQMTLSSLELVVTQDGRFILKGLTISPSDLLGTFKSIFAEQTDTVLLIRADALSPHQAVVHAMQTARDAGVSKVQFATQVR